MTWVSTMTPSPDITTTPATAPNTVPPHAAPAAGWLVFRGPVGVHLAELWLPLSPELPSAPGAHPDCNPQSTGDLRNAPYVHAGNAEPADREARYTARPLGDAASTWTGPRLMLQLAHAEPLVGAVEQWLRCPWLLQPVDMLPEVTVGPGVCDAEVQTAALAPLGTRLRLPWAALASPPPAWLLSPHVTWPGVHTELCLDTARAADMADLSDGTLVWLTPSLGREWPVTVRPVGGHLPARAGVLARAPTARAGNPPQDARIGLELHATLPGVLHVPTADAGAHSEVATEMDTDAEIVWHGVPPIGLEQWLGWKTRPAAPSASLTLRLPLPAPVGLSLQQGGVVQVRGELIPLAGGYAFQVRNAIGHAPDLGHTSPPFSVESPPAAPAAQPPC